MDPIYSRVFGRAPIYDIVFSCLDPRSLVWFARTCRTSYLAVADFQLSTRAYNIDRHFSRYFTDPLAFRSLQARTNTLVSGSNALQFLARTLYPESDLDIYTHPGHSFEVAQFLVEEEGYKFAPRDEDAEDEEEEELNWRDAIPDNWDGTEPRIITVPISLEKYPLEGISGVWTFEKAGAKGETLKVQIIEAAASPLQLILAFHSTCVMNFITSDAAYSLYPMATFAMRSSLAMYTARDAERALAKYVERGWRVYFFPTPQDLTHAMNPPFMLNKTRWVGDAHMWVVPLDQTGVAERPPLSPASAPLKFDHVRCNGWTLRMCPEALDGAYHCHSYALQTTIFRYNYLIPDQDLSLIVRDANRQGKLCHRHVLKKDWVWFDSDLPGFLQVKL